MAERSSIFDMIGPIMVGPSSSHTAAVVRIGRFGYQMLGGQPEKAEISFYNSFATTFEGHGSDRAILAGLMGMETDDLRIKEAMQLAQEAGLDYKLVPSGQSSVLHPNTIKVVLSKGDLHVRYVAESHGGGVIFIKEVNGFPANFSGSMATLVIVAEDVKGSIASIATILSVDECNIATMSCSRKAKNDLACLFFELDNEPREVTIQYLKSLKWVKEVTPIDNVY